MSGNKSLNRTGRRVTDIHRSGNKRVIMALAAVSAVIFVSGMVWLHFHPGIPDWVMWEESVFADSTGQYEVSLRGKTIQVKSFVDAGKDMNDVNDTRVIWTSPDAVRVQKALSCDIDNDGADELVLLCWKKGRYGEHKPFWVDQDEASWSQHLFVYEYQAEKISPKWMSSYIGQDVADMISNGKQAPHICLWFRSPDDEMSSWKWDSWGFTKLDTQITFVAFGDLLVHEPIYRYGLQNSGSFDYLFENVQDRIDGSDVAVINQETPLTDDLSMVSDYPRFGTPVNVGQAVVDAGFDVVTCATNHALDRGAEGVDFTKRFFEDNQVACLGIQAAGEIEDQPYVVIWRKGVSFALLNYTYGTNGIRMPEGNPNMVHLFPDGKFSDGKLPDGEFSDGELPDRKLPDGEFSDGELPDEEFQDNKLRKVIAQAKSEADLVIVFAHWGTEYAQETDAFQQRWTQVFLESGVDVVVGTHPHVLQPYEMLTADDGHRMLVYYSIGNFISAQPEKRCVRGGMAEFTVSLTPAGYQVTEYGLQPLAIEWSPGGKYVAVPELYE